MNKKPWRAVLFLASVSAGFVLTVSAYGSEPATAGQKAGPRRTNVTIDTNELGPISLNEKTEAKEEKPVIFRDGDVSFDFNENAEPNINKRF